MRRTQEASAAKDEPLEPATAMQSERPRDSSRLLELAEHHGSVEAWLCDNASRLACAEDVMDLLVASLRTIWKRSCQSLGEMPLRAVFERVLREATLRHPVLEGIGIHVDDAVGHRWIALAVPPSRAWAALVRASRFVIVELIAVLGSLSGATLASALHAELRKITRRPAAL